MHRARISWVLAVFVLLGCECSLAAESAPSTAAEFLKRSGLESIHADYVAYFRLLSEGKAEDAFQRFTATFPPRLSSPNLDHLRRFTDALRSVFAKGVEDVELVGVLTFSNKSSAMYYVLNSSTGPIVVVLVPFQWQGKWRTHSWFIHGEMDQIMRHLQGIVRFPKSIVVPLKPQGKTT